MMVFGESVATIIGFINKLFIYYKLSITVDTFFNLSLILARPGRLEIKYSHLLGTRTADVRTKHDLVG